MNISNVNALIIALVLIAQPVFAKTTYISGQGDTLPAWEHGFLDIHHINTGEGNSTFFQMPDGTTMLLDAGTVNKISFEKHNYPLKATEKVPDSTLSAGQRITAYIRSMSQNVAASNRLDYLVISHFHSDHYGAIFDVLDELDVKTLIDRAYPDYSFPIDLRKNLAKDKLFQRYLKIIEGNESRTERLVVGSYNQICLQYSQKAYPSFSVFNVKNNATVWNMATESSENLFAAEDMVEYYKGGYNENPLSMAFKFSYGKFDYYAGADNTGLQDGILPAWFDVESPIARIVGKVDVMALDHHGNRDANNNTLIETLDPHVAIQQVYSSDQPGQEVYYRLRKLGKGEKRLLYATNMHPETQTTYGPWFLKGYQSMQGHVIVRVYPDGTNYKIFVLDEKDLSVKQESEMLKSE